ncbi:MAG: iron-containing alcohol dehydrogenase [Rikenellaceae bacterium]|jgi:NADP-dependent alcohol dehydrogenase|nr:iron-containing alcohol dehydrogenase [Rikenellaceae bacterium]
MKNFTFQNKTKLIFGRGMIARLAQEIPQTARLMVTFGGGSVRRNGVYDQVVAALAGRKFVEFWGIEPNPKVETLRKAVALGKEHDIDYILAVGGGSVADGSKLIAGSIRNAADPWDLVLNPGKFGEILPLATVMTLPATGSEMNSSAVISNLATDEKYGITVQNPEFSILDPETTFSLPKEQIAYGICDTFVHVMEQYMTTAGQSPLMDRWAEGILNTLVEVAPKIARDQTDYAVMADFMLSATMALNGFIGMGVSQDWATHQIGHELTALHGISHGQTLAIVLPAMMRVLKKQKMSKLLQYGERVWGIFDGSDDDRAELAIVKTEEFFRSLGLATRLCELNVGEETIREIERRFTERGVAYGEAGNVDGKLAAEILHVC